MKLTIPRRALHAALSTVTRAISNQSSLPILANVLLETSGEDRLRLRATDLDLSIECEIAAAVQAAGAITLPAKTLTEIVAALPDGDVTIEVDESHAGSITCGKSKYRIHGLPPGEFPPGVDIERVAHANVEEGTLHALIRRVLPAASSDTTRPVLTGVLWESDDAGLRLVATDTHRLVIGKAATVDPGREAPPVARIIPARAMRELLRLLKPDGERVIHCEFGANACRFRVHCDVITTRLIEGTYPDVERVIPKHHSTRLTLNVADLRKAVKRAAIVAREDANRITLSHSEGTLSVYACAGDMGTALEILALEDHEDDDAGDISWCMNAAYTLDLLDAVDAEFVVMEMTEPLKPILARPIGDDSLRVIMMPMQKSGG